MLFKTKFSRVPALIMDDWGCLKGQTIRHLSLSNRKRPRNQKFNMVGSDSLIRGLFQYNQDMTTLFSGRLLAPEEWSNIRPGEGGEK